MLLNKRVFAVSLLAILTTSNVNASGFAIAENSASGMGSAFAGASAIAEDASTTYFNPAGLSKLKGSQMVFAGHIVSVSSPFTNNGSTLNPALGGGTLLGPNDDGSTTAFIPNFYYATELNDKWAFGLGITAPFGNASEYSDTWVGRYHATKSEVTTININPSASYKVDNKLSVGFGVSVQYIEATLDNKLDSAAICNSTPFAAACAGAGLGAPGSVGDVSLDSNQSLTGDDWSFGWNFGLLYDLSNETRMGLAYRSNVKHTLKGDVDFTMNANLQGLLDVFAPTLFTDTGISAGIDLPETLSLSLHHVVNPKWVVLADVTWTKWKRFDQLVIDFDNPAQDSSIIPENWENSLRYSLGVNYQADAKWIYRAGLALDETPIPSAEDMTPRIPDSDRIWLSFGFGYKMSDSFGIDVGYSHLFFDDMVINNTDASFGHTLTGSYDVSVDLFSAQLNWNF